MPNYTGDVEVNTISSNNAAVLPKQLVRLGEMQEALDAIDVTSTGVTEEELPPLIFTKLTTSLIDGNSIEWTTTETTMQPNVVLNDSGGLEITASGLGVVFGDGNDEVARGNHTHDTIAAAKTFSDTNTILLDDTLNVVTGALNIRTNGGLTSSSSGVAVDYNWVARADHTHADLHKPITLSNSNSVTLSLGAGANAQVLTASARLNSTPTSGYGKLHTSASGLETVLGTGADEAAPGTHTHANATVSQSGFLSAGDKAKLDGAVNLSVFEVPVTLHHSGYLVEGRQIGNTIIPTTDIEITAITYGFMAGTDTSTYIDLMVNDASVFSGIMTSNPTPIWMEEFNPGETNRVGNSLSIIVPAYTSLKMVCSDGPVDGETGPTNISVCLNVKYSAQNLPEVRVNCGGEATGTFLADTYYTGGETQTRLSGVDLTHSPYALDEYYYLSRRCSFEESFTYAIAGLSPYFPYKVRLHMCDPGYSNNGTPVVTLQDVECVGATTTSNQIDVASLAGGSDIACVFDMLCTANSSGVINVTFEAVVPGGCASVCAIEVIRP